MCFRGFRITICVAFLALAMGCEREFDHAGVRASGTACATCHLNDYQGARDPVHIDVYPTTCEGCHNTRKWKPAEGLGMSHPLDRFALSGGHGRVECTTCHTDGFGPGDTPSDCISCHSDDKKTGDTSIADHESFANTCQTCHTIVGWKPASDGHPRDRFPLMGGHDAVNCTSCHTVGYAPGDTPNDCISCHMDDRATGDQNVGGHPAFANECTTCHTIFGWKPAIDGHPRDRFPLRGQHEIALCTDCHTQGFGADQTSSECIACHAADKASADSKVTNHTSFGADCTGCHTDLGWVPASTVTHPTDRFPLVGTHGLIDCAACHTTGFGPGDTPNECAACHTDDKAKADAAVGGHAGFGNACTSCHSELGWKPSTGHPDTRFALRGTHSTIACVDCHTNGYAPGATPSACVSCHASDLNSANAKVSGHTNFGNDCAGCHQDGDVWRPASQGSHPLNRFPLNNRHGQIQCTACHTVGFGPGDTPNECVSCHASDRSRANANISGHNGFGTACASCHTDDGWVPAQGHPENRFQINGGPHGRFSCTQCHNSNLGSSVGGMNSDCIGCHTGEHTRSRMANKHKDVGRYNDDGTQNFCLDCHPNGRN